MNSGELLCIESSELRFFFELNKQSRCALRLSNKTSNNVACKVYTTIVIIPPGSELCLTMIMPPQKKAPTDMELKDKLLIQSLVVCSGTVAQDLNQEMFIEKPVRVVEEHNLKMFQFNEYSLVTNPLTRPRSLLANLATQTEALMSNLKKLKINLFDHNAQLDKKQGYVKIEKASDKGKTKVQQDLEEPLLPECLDKSKVPQEEPANAIELALADANKKIQELEAALKDTELVLKGIGRHIEELST